MTSKADAPKLDRFSRRRPSYDVNDVKIGMVAASALPLSPTAKTVCAPEIVSPGHPAHFSGFSRVPHQTHRHRRRTAPH